jgi:hypothetical protein
MSCRKPAMDRVGETRDNKIARAIDIVPSLVLRLVVDGAVLVDLTIILFMILVLVSMVTLVVVVIWLVIRAVILVTIMFVIRVRVGVEVEVDVWQHNGSVLR